MNCFVVRLLENSMQCHLMHSVETVVESMSKANIPSIPIFPGYPKISITNCKILLNTYSRPENASTNGIFKEVAVV